MVRLAGAKSNATLKNILRPLAHDRWGALQALVALAPSGSISLSTIALGAMRSRLFRNERVAPVRRTASQGVLKQTGEIPAAAGN